MIDSILNVSYLFGADVVRVEMATFNELIGSATNTFDTVEV